jgi:serine/threonine protein kinase
MALDDPLIGKQLGDYTIQRLLGRGGMSRVYQGYDENLDRLAAVKVISGDFVTTTEEEYTRRFQSEARAIARLRHPNIVGVYQFGRTEGIYYMAQVFLEGKDLRSLLKEYADRNQRIPPDEVLRIIRDVGSALDYAHEQGVIHRDIKPSNIMLEKKTGRAILMDFGLALSVQEGTMGDTFGSAHYIAPEQAVSSAKSVPQSDLYSLGIVLYEMLAGRVPFDDPSVMSVALKHLNELPPPPTMYNPDLPPAVEAVIMRVLDKDPKRRHATGQELTEDLVRAFHIDKPGEAPDVKDSPAVVDMLDSKTRPPVPWWQQQIEQQQPPPAEHPKPSASTAAKMREQEQTGGLARRFARRKERKEEEAALQSITEESLQIDDASLDSLLNNMPDPSEIGLVGEGATGITRPERPSQLSRPSPPRPATGGGQKKRRRSRVGILLPVILVLAILAGGLYLGGQFGGGDDGSSDGTSGSDTPPSATLSAAEQNQTTVALAVANATETKAALTAEALASPTRQATKAPTAAPSKAPTSANTSAETGTPGGTAPPTAAPTAEPTGEPTQTPTEEPIQTSTGEPTAEPTQEPTATVEPTDESTSEPTSESTATAAPTAVAEGPVVRAPNMRALYQDGQFLLVNLSGRTLDITKVSFEQVLPDGTTRSLKATAWNRSDIPIKPNRMAPASCYELLTGDADQLAPSANQCSSLLGFYRTTVTRNHFWVSNDPEAVFTVHYEGIDKPLAECVVGEHSCDFYIGADAANVVVAAATPTPTMVPTASGETAPEPNVRLMYNKDNFLLINISSDPIDISQLVFKQEMPTGAERTFMAAEWDDQPNILGDTTNLEPNNCYELVTSEGTWVRPLRTNCETFLGWFRSYIVERFFWVSTQPNAIFTVQRQGDSAPLAMCTISAGECQFYLPSAAGEPS